MSRKELFPYRVATGVVSIRVVDAEDPLNPDLDLEWLETGPSTDPTQQLDLRGEREWQQLLIGIEARVPEQHLTSLIPPGSDPSVDTMLILSVRCPSTKMRFPVELEPDKTEVGLWRGDLLLNRRDVRSFVELLPVLCRRTSIPSDATIPKGIARDRHALLASGPSKGLSIDYIARGSHGVLKFRVEDFRNSGNVWRASHPETLYYLDPDPRTPILWINARHQSLAAVLFDKSESGPDAAMRAVISAWLADSARMQLLQVAVAGIRVVQEHGYVEEPEGWRGTMLRKYLPRIYPTAVDYEEALALAARAREGADQFGAFVSQAMTVNQEIAESPAQFTKAVRAMESYEIDPQEVLFS